MKSELKLHCNSVASFATLITSNFSLIFIKHQQCFFSTSTLQFHAIR